MDEIHSDHETTAGGRSIEPLPEMIGSIQPAGGFCMRIELLWGYLRRFLLRIFRRGYVRRMAASRLGERNPAPHAMLDSRDAKFYRNQPGCYYWSADDDRFTWRGRLPFIREGLAEIIIFTILFLAVGIGLWFLFWPLIVVPALLELEVVSFFRNPARTIPSQPGLLVSPADGTIDLIEEIDHDPLLDGPAVRIQIFLSVFNVHINRSPLAGQVVSIHYKHGKCVSATRLESAEINAQLELVLEETAAPHRLIRMRQITGMVARRIVCWSSPGQLLERGEQFGMIKLGSRTELVLPLEDGLQLQVAKGDKVQAGITVMARYPDSNPTSSDQPPVPAGEAEVD